MTAGPRFFLRRCAVVLGDLRHDGLRVAFKAEKSLRMEPNTLDLRVYNLNRDHRAAAQRKGLRVVVEAGYAGALETVFSGDARTVDSVRDGPDWVTHVQCGDGERAYLYQRCNLSFGPGVSARAVLKAVAESMGLNPGNSIAKIGSAQLRGGLQQFVNGYAAAGNASAELARLMETAGLQWSIQDGALQVLAGERDTTNNTAILLTPATGLVGSPDHGSPDKRGLPAVLKVRSLMQGQLRPGSKIRVESDGAKGSYRCEKVSHAGDTAGPEWYTNVEARPL